VVIGWGIAAGDGKSYFLSVLRPLASQSEMAEVTIGDEMRGWPTKNEAYIANSGDGSFLLLLVR
jgi:hypothetical protein